MKFLMKFLKNFIKDSNLRLYTKQRSKKNEGPVSIQNLLRLRPEKWLADSLIDAFYSLLNRFEKGKNLPVEETAYFVKIEFLWGNHIANFYEEVDKLNIRDFELKENLIELETL